MKVMNFIKVYEVNNEELKINEDKSMTVVSHWNRKDWICLTLDNETVITVNAEDLIKAIQNATNH